MSVKPSDSMSSLKFKPGLTIQGMILTICLSKLVMSSMLLSIGPTRKRYIPNPCGQDFHSHFFALIHRGNKYWKTVGGFVYWGSEPSLTRIVSFSYINDNNSTKCPPESEIDPESFEQW
ncbi:hypothetical protein BGZ88_000155 [Linnemannia elongata]|nr:hypothetical protein BGZ88_000155 [Linnemannia elongata]